MKDKTDMLKIVQLEAQLKLYEPIISSLQTLPVLQESIKQVKKQLDKMENKTEEREDVINDLHRSLDLLEFKLEDTIKDIENDKKEIEKYLEFIDNVKGMGWKILCRILPTLIVLTGIIFGVLEFFKEKLN